MIIQGSPEILRGPRGLNGFGDFGLSPPPPDNGTVFDVCPPGSMMVDGVCIGDPSTYGPIGPEIFAPDPNVKTATPGISPLLILAAAAAFFFAG